MIRALYTAASGMNAQQANIDNIAHNLSNVNTTGFKKSRVEFEDLVYQQTTAPGSPTSTTGESPIGLEIGLGTRPIATARDFQTGNLRSTSAPLDLAIEGRGFFQVTLPDGQTAYTRAGKLHLNAGRARSSPPRATPIAAADHDSRRTPRRSASRRTASSRWRSRARRRRSRSARSSWRRSRTPPASRRSAATSS